MLDPEQRQLLVEALRPPAGFHLDFAIATTYSLDLVTLLTAPLACTAFEWEGPGGAAEPDPVVLLDAIRRHAQHLVIFCEAGRIAVPRQHQPLFGYLEDRVVEVLPRRAGRAFHPKVWLLRYAGPEKQVAYRLIVSSRNLSFDASWDAVLILDGVLAERKYAFARNHPLGNFVATLPTLACRPVSADIREPVARMADEVRRVRFEPPEGVEDFKFWALGIGGREVWPFGGRTDRLLIMSPFLTDWCLERLAGQGGREHVLISRPDSLSALAPDTLARFAGVKVLSEGAEPEAEEDLIQENAQGAVYIPDDAEELGLTGLHAKVFIAEAGWDARVWVGSANATTAAFSGNVEFLVELRGKKSRFGADALLNGEAQSSFGKLLEDFRPPAAVQREDPSLETMKDVLEKVRRSLAAAGPVLRLEAAGGDQFEALLLLEGAVPAPWPSGLTVRCWPISLPAAQRSVAVTLPLAAEGSRHLLARFGTMSPDLLTSFVAFHLQLAAGEHRVEQRFVLNARLEGAPPDRQQRLLRSALRSGRDFLRYLLLLLAEGDVDTADIVARASRWLSRGGGSGGLEQTALLETLVRTLHQDPAKLDQVAELVEQLRNAPDSNGVIPEGFQEIWEPIWQARQEVPR